MKKVLAAVLIFVLTNQLLGQKVDVNAKELVLKTLKAIREVNGLKYNLKITERGKKGYNYYESSVKFNRNPRQIYLYIKGIEVLWLQGQNDGRALVKPNSFPYFNLNLDPMGSLMRQDQHHTLNEMGYDYFASIIQNTVDRIGDDFNSAFTVVGEEWINNRPCYKIIIDNKEFAYVDYTIGENESITSIARKLFIAEYMIVEKNPKFRDYFDILKPGKVIMVPNWYCRYVVLYVDRLMYLPISVNVMDDRGIFEQYNYHQLQLNPRFEEGEFTRKYKDYGF